MVLACAKVRHIGGFTERAAAKVNKRGPEDKLLNTVAWGGGGGGW